MSSEQPIRLSYEDSCRHLQRLGLLSAGEIPPLPAARPEFGDDEPVGVSFYKTLLSDDPLENVTLPRTFFGRSEIGYLSFRNADLSESRMCWNDFINVDFTDANLSRSDLRASGFNLTRFCRTNLEDADLRHSSFAMCDFAGARMRGAMLTRKQGQQLSLSDEQRREIDWQETDGEEPPGG